MAKIYSVDTLFECENLSLGNPITKSGGYFMKFVAGKNGPLYFQSPECYVKQGAVKSGKKMFFDLVFSNENDDVFLSWLDSLEEKTRQILFDNRDKWFETPLDQHDIESSMMSPYKPYKLGKCFLVRAGVPMTLDTCDLKIYDENEQETDVSNVVDGTKCLVIFEFRGIRCSIRSFQFEVELKQMLLVKPTNLFDKCIVRPKTVSDTKLNNKTEIKTIPKTKPEEDFSESVVLVKENAPILVDQIEETTTLANMEEPDDSYELEQTSVIPEPPEIEELDLGKLLEVVEPTKEENENIQLKPKHDIYLKLYREAREKAREAKMIALQNYLEAKRIKNTYFLEDMSESDEDFYMTEDKEGNENP
jgi:hypothetical protein